MKKGCTLGAVYLLFFMCFLSLGEGPWGTLAGGLAATALCPLTLWAARLWDLPCRYPGRLFSPPRLSFSAVAPFALLILGASALTAFVAARLGCPDRTVYEGPMWQLLLLYALLPALAEESAFRLCLPALLHEAGPGGAILCSSLLFALMHAHPARIPYALLAGLLLGVLAEVCDSPLPGFVCHLVNNACSLFVLTWGRAALPWVLGALGAGTALALVWFLGGHGIDKLRRSERLPDFGPPAWRAVGELCLSPMLLVMAFLVWLTTASVIGA